MRSTRRRSKLAALSITAIAVTALTPALLAGPPSASADTVAAGGGEFVPIPATNIVRTTHDVGWTGQIQPGQTKSVTALGIGPVPSSGVDALLLHITTLNSGGTGPSNGSLWAWGTGSARPTYAVLDHAQQGTVADNNAIVQVGTGGQVSFYDGPNAQPVDVVVDVEGYVTSDAASAPGATFTTVTATRIINTNTGTGGRSMPLASTDAPWTFHLLGAGGVVPTSGVTAVALNLGAQNTSMGCWVQVQPTGSSLSSTFYPRVDTYIGYSAQELAIVAPGTNGNVDLTTNCPSADIFADVEGYYTSSASGDVYVPIDNPSRIVDTRSNLGITGSLTAGRSITGANAVPLTEMSGSTDGVPGKATAVALSIRSLNGSTNGYNTLWTDGAPEPTNTSSIDVDPNVTESNLIFLPTGDNHTLDIAAHSSNSAESNDLLVDVQGYLMPVEDPTESQAPSTTDDGSTATNTGPAIVSGTFTNGAGDALGNLTVVLSTTDGTNDNGTPITPTVIGTTTTAADGSWSFTVPTPLPADAQGYADANGGVLNMVATVGGVASDGMTFMADDFLSAGVATGSATTPGSVAARAESPDVIAVHPDVTTDPSSFPTPTDAQMDQSAASVEWNADSTSLDNTLGGWQSDTSADPSGYTPDVVNGVNYAGVHPMDNPCWPLVDKVLKTQTKYTVVGEYHAYWDATSAFQYTETMSSTITTLESVGAGKFAAAGTQSLSGSASVTTGNNPLGPYKAQQILVPIKYQQIQHGTHCVHGGDTYTTDVEAKGYHLPPNSPTFKYGRNVAYKDGCINYEKSPKANRDWVTHDGAIKLTSGKSITFGVGGEVFGLGVAVQTTYDRQHFEVINALSRRDMRHEVWGAKGPIDSGHAGIVLSC